MIDKHFPNIHKCWFSVISLIFLVRALVQIPILHLGIPELQCNMVVGDDPDVNQEDRDMTFEEIFDHCHQDMIFRKALTIAIIREIAKFRPGSQRIHWNNKKFSKSKVSDHTFSFSITFPG